MVILLFFLGASLASFFVLVGERLALKQSIIFPSSHCGICQHKLDWHELVPVISFYLLKGKCSTCMTTIAITSPLWEFFSGSLFVLLYIVGIQIPSVVVSSIIWFSYIVMIHYNENKK